MTLLRTFFVSIAIAMAGVIAFAFATSDQPAATATEKSAEGHALLTLIHHFYQILYLVLQQHLQFFQLT